MRHCGGTKEYWNHHTVHSQSQEALKKRQVFTAWQKVDQLLQLKNNVMVSLWAKVLVMKIGDFFHVGTYIKIKKTNLEMDYYVLCVGTKFYKVFKPEIYQ